MCISVFTTSHPEYPFILISNRDEFLARPTLRADWWDEPNQHVLGGRDLERRERGSWLGITKQGRIAILTNFREEGDYAINREKSRGAITNSWLCVAPGTREHEESEEAYAKSLMSNVGIDDMGGFTMLFGTLRRPRAHTTNGNGDATTMPGLAIISNRTSNPATLKRIGTTTNETHGVSNSHYGDRTWPKVVHGEQFLNDAVAKSLAEAKEEASSEEAREERLVSSLFAILCSDSLPRRRNSEDWTMYIRHMRNSIMIPPAKGKATSHNTADDLRAADETLQHHDAVLKAGKGAYGTSKQTVILVDVEGKVTFVERTLFDQGGIPVPKGERDVRYEFDIEGWNDHEEVYNDGHDYEG